MESLRAFPERQTRRARTTPARPFQSSSRHSGDHKIIPQKDRGIVQFCPWNVTLLAQDCVDTPAQQLRDVATQRLGQYDARTVTVPVVREEDRLVKALD